MKILKSFALILLMVVVLGCSKDDDKNNDSTTSLVGTWKLTAEKIDGENQELDACELKGTAIFTATTIKTLEYESEYDGANCVLFAELNGTYTRSGSTLNFSFSLGGTTIEKSVEIIKLTSTTLETKDVDEDNGEIILDTFTRQ